MLISRKSLIRVALATTPAIALLGLAAGPASASRPRQGSVAASCDVVDSDTGQVVGQAAEGTRVGLFYCGSDGQWHFGTVILDHSKVVAEPTTTTPPKTRLTAPRTFTTLTTR